MAPPRPIAALALPALIVFVLVACGSVPRADAPIEWADVDRWSVHVVTRDEDGSSRVARIWLVLHEGHAAIRTGGSRWRANIERGSKVWLRVDGVDYPVVATAVDEPDARRAIDVGFERKYGWQERAFIRAERAASDDAYLLLTPAPAP